MVLILIGLVILAIAVHFRRNHGPVRGAEPVPGRIVDVDARRTQVSGSNRMLYAVTVEYRDPATGERRVLPPKGHQTVAYEVGDEVTLQRDPATGSLRVPLEHPRAQVAMPFVFAAAVIALGVADLLG